MGYLVRWRAADLSLTGVVPFDRLEFVPRFNAGGTWSLDVDGTSAAAEWVQPGGGVVIARDDDPGHTLMSGPVRGITEAVTDGPGEVLTLAGVDDTSRLATRRIWPVPGNAIGSQSSSHWTASTQNVESIMRSVVDLNAGPSALAARRITGLTIAANGNLGSTKTSVAYRFANLLEVLTGLGLGESLGFRVVQVGAGLVFQVYATADLTSVAKFSRDLGNLRSYSYGIEAPSVTDAIVAGSGVGAARTLLERTNTTAQTEWGERFEDFVDARDEADTYRLQDTGDAALVSGGPRASLSISPVDIPALQYGVDYNLGDKVSVVTRRGGVIQDVLRAVTITAGPAGEETVVPVVGSAGTDDADADLLYRQVRDLTKRIRNIEAVV